MHDLLSALGDTEPLVCAEACTSIGIVSQTARRTRQQMRTRLQATANHDTSAEVRRHARWAIDMVA